MCLKTILIFTIFLVMVGCVPQAPTSAKRAASAAATSGTTSTTTTETEIYWYLDKKITGTLSINASITDIGYLRGKAIDSYLSLSGKSSASYCLVMTYAGTTKTQLRIKATPFSFYNLSTKKTERALTLNFPNDNDQNSTCSGTINLQTLAAVATTLPQVCSTCTSAKTSTKTELFALNTTTSSYALTPISLSSLFLKIDFANNTNDSSNNNTCSNSTCATAGYDCCLDGQCVNDGTLKGNYASSPDYTQALADVAANPLNFIKYPNVYNVCLNVNHPTPPPTPVTTDPASEYATYLKNLTALYNCQEGGGSSSPTYASCTPTTVSGFYEVKSKVWKMCGCVADIPNPNTTATPPSACPDFKLVPVKSSTGTIESFICSQTAINPEPKPFQKSQVPLSGRTVPHRFFAGSDGVTQEGEEFSYFEPLTLESPVSGSFNMNSILGQMDVNLTKARPAVVIDVEIDSSYLIEGTSGLYIPCAKCTKDFWFQSFTPFPMSSKGLGLQSIGYTTERDEYVTNTTLGNYEDTKFGRACYVPPTMLPYSHYPNADVTLQRQNRLQTQAAYYINGYQRDWFGFNLGALIASFDGVTWFAAGTGRVATATSNKLFLAINAPFGDLAENTTLTVTVSEATGAETATDKDYDPELAPDDPEQNKAASCQRHHICETDIDCVTRLGFEYSCLDVTKLKTNWPKFNSAADEVINNGKINVSLPSVLVNFPTTLNNKRCVYRGMGAPCKVSVTPTQIDQKKALTCAPNFYCASLTSTKFNKELVRTVSPEESMLFGREANILGRPLKYLGASSALTSEIQNNIDKNMDNMVSANDFGLCMPGKKIDDPSGSTQHGAAQASAIKTDYVNQIGTCDSSKTGGARTYACPVFDMDESSTTYGNILTPSIALNTGVQNACGMESYKLDGTTKRSPFAPIEFGILSSAPTLQTPGLAQDGCLRRAGAVCHTDLDCSPNKLHANQAILYDKSFFGGTEAERRYFQENLICSQAQPEPSIASENYLDYDMSKNRCCREIGADITMVTAVNATYKSLIPNYDATNTTLSPATFASSNPVAVGRYSRYSVAGNALTTLTTDAPLPATGGTPSMTTFAGGTFNPYTFQWKTLNDTARRTCCGGSWVRKFSDDTHNWINSQRFLTLDVGNFSCLNYKTELPLNKPADISQAQYDRERALLCRYPADGGCANIAFPASADASFALSTPSNALGATILTINTTPQIGNSGQLTITQNLSDEIPFLPIPFPNPSTSRGYKQQLYSAVVNDLVIKATKLYIPIYANISGLDWTTAGRVQLKYVDANGNQVRLVNLTYTTPCPVSLNANDIAGENRFCIDAASRAILIRGEQATSDWAYAGIIMNLPSYDRGRTPGNDLYYLTKLGRLDLLGIPQIFYEPIICNTHSNKIVDNLFKSSITEIADFPYDLSTATGTEKLYSSTVASQTSSTLAFQNSMDIPPVFSEDQFSCCLAVGSETSDASKCCTNYAVTNIATAKKECKLPGRTNLNVYLNKFVSSEGFEKFDELSFSDSDFNPWTGEPKLDNTVYNKIIAFGTKYCGSGKVRAGGLFGNYYAEPFTSGYYTPEKPGATEIDNTRYGPADSIYDNETSAISSNNPENLNGAAYFEAGFRWNHHYYCL